MPILLLTGGAVSAQVTTGSFICTVVDEKQKAPLADVRVTFKSSALFQPRVYNTDAKGETRALLLPPGNYEVEIFKAGFRPSLIKDVRVGLGTNLSQEVVLKDTTSTVTAAAHDLDAGVEYTKGGKRQTPKGSKK